MNRTLDFVILVALSVEVGLIGSRNDWHVSAIILAAFGTGVAYRALVDYYDAKERKDHR